MMFSEIYALISPGLRLKARLFPPTFLGSFGITRLFPPIGGPGRLARGAAELASIHLGKRQGDSRYARVIIPASNRETTPRVAAGTSVCKRCKWITSECPTNLQGEPLQRGGL
jgi:hypothetical protein